MFKGRTIAPPDRLAPDSMSQKKELVKKYEHKQRPTIQGDLIRHECAVRGMPDDSRIVIYTVTVENTSWAGEYVSERGSAIPMNQPLCHIAVYVHDKAVGPQAYQRTLDALAESYMFTQIGSVEHESTAVERVEALLDAQGEEILKRDRSSS